MNDKQWLSICTNKVDNHCFSRKIYRVKELKIHIKSLELDT